MHHLPRGPEAASPVSAVACGMHSSRAARRQAWRPAQAARSFIPVATVVVAISENAHKIIINGYAL